MLRSMVYLCLCLLLVHFEPVCWLWSYLVEENMTATLLGSSKFGENYQQIKKGDPVHALSCGRGNGESTQERASVNTSDTERASATAHVLGSSESKLQGADPSETYSQECWCSCRQSELKENKQQLCPWISRQTYDSCIRFSERIWD